MQSWAIALAVYFASAGLVMAEDCTMPGAAETGAAFDWRRPVPTDTGTFTSGFGKRVHPILGFARPHDGVDWSGPIGTQVRAAASGRVVEVGCKGEFGNRVRVDHGGGWETTYSHLQRFDQNLFGECVVAAELIGLMGATGLSPGPLLHFELYRHGVAVDPVAYGRAGQHLP